MAYAVEIYRRLDAASVGEPQVAAAGDALRTEGLAITFLGSVAIPGDEMTFWLFDAASRAVIDELLRRLGIVPDRVVEVIASSYMTDGPNSGPGRTS